MHLFVVRHGRSSANSAGVLAGRADGVHLDDEGRSQAETLLERFDGVEVTRIVGSPLSRCRETAEPLCIERKLAYDIDERLNEVDYGLWSGRKLEELSSDPMWARIQERPTSVTFPEGEAMTSLFDRTKDFLDGLRTLGEDEIVVAFTHGDVAKALISNALAAPHDEFQRIVIDPASISVLRVSEERRFALRVNDSGTTLKMMVTKKTNQNVVGGGS